MLAEAGLLIEINVDQPRERLYQPAVDVRMLKISYILSRVDNYGSTDIPVIKNREYEKILKMLEDFEEKLKQSESDVIIADI